MDEITEPIVCCPNDPDDAKLLSEVEGRTIDEVRPTRIESSPQPPIQSRESSPQPPIQSPH